MKRIFLIVAILLSTLSVFVFHAFAGVSPDGIWEEISLPTGTMQAKALSAKEPWIKPDKFRLFSLNEQSLNTILGQAPVQVYTPSSRSLLASVQMTLPMPDGSFAAVTFVDSPVMAPALAAKFPEIKTYMGYLTDNPTVSVAFDKTPAGFHAQVLAPEGTWYIDPYIAGESSYTSYYKRDYRPVKGFTDYPTLKPEGLLETAGRLSLASPLPTGDKIRKYRLAIACTGEYAQFQCGGVCTVTNPNNPKAAPMAAIVTTINRVRQIYLRELAIDLELVTNNDQLVYLTPGTPFTNSDVNKLILESQTVIDGAIGDANYDLGHTMSTGAGGMSYLGIPCSTGWKAKAVTGSSSPKGDGYDVDYVCHEMGHQFNANHPFNGRMGECLFKHYVSSVAYEPGSGSTIMAYDGLCDADNIQTYSDPIFHSANFDEIQNYVAQPGSCYTLSGALTTITVQAGADETIPANTPFILNGTASGGGGSLTYLWEEYDRSGVQAALTDPDDGKMPLFRVYAPSSTAMRIFPRLATLAAGITDKAERLPQVGRAMNFRLVVRDGKGGIAYGSRKITVDGNSGPFRVTAPVAGAEVSGAITVAWDKANTDLPPVSAANVAVYLSTDGGYSFDMQNPLMASMVNNGSAQITLPSINAAKARIMVKAVDHAFFAVSGGDFKITGDGGALSVNPAYDLQSSGDQGGPFQNAFIDYTLQNTGTAAITWLASRTQPTQTWLTLSAAGGTLNAGESFTVKVSVNDNAKNLVRDNYQDTVTFKNDTNGVGTTARLVGLKVGMTVKDTLSVLEPDGLLSWGMTGGPFSPTSNDFIIRNMGNIPLIWKAAKTQAWLTLSSEGGTLAPGASTTVSATINQTATGLSADIYNDIITFTNTTNALGNTTRAVSLTIYAPTTPGSLVILPDRNITLSGCIGGPYAPLNGNGSYTLRNIGNTAIDWTAVKTEKWLTLSPASGTLAPGASSTVTATINQTEVPVEAKTYTDPTVIFTNQTNNTGGGTRSVTLQINAITLTAMPFGAYLASGIAGESVSPAFFDYTLQNMGCVNVAIAWQAVSSSAWMTPSPAEGELASGATATVRISVNDQVKLLAPDFYTTALYFLNKTGKNAVGRTLGLSLSARGDVNGDSKVDLIDTVLALQSVMGQAVPAVRLDYAASGVDVNGDNKVGLPEAVYALQTTAGLRQGNFSLKSSVMTSGQRIPDLYADAYADTRKGISPPLSWSNPPAGTKSFVLFVDDPDNIPYSNPLSGATWDYWIVYNLPASTTSLAANAGAVSSANLPSGAIQGMNASGTYQYIGPAPGKYTGMHRYFFRMFAISEPTITPTDATRWKDIEAAMTGKILGQCELMVTYSNPVP